MPKFSLEYQPFSLTTGAWYWTQGPTVQLLTYVCYHVIRVLQYFVKKLEDTARYAGFLLAYFRSLLVYSSNLSNFL